jgi:hypothetical protein
MITSPTARPSIAGATPPPTRLPRRCTATELLREKGLPWLLHLAATAMLPSLAPEPLVLGTTMFLQTLGARLPACGTVIAMLFPGDGPRPSAG